MGLIIFLLWQDQSTGSVVQKFDLSPGENLVSVFKRLRSTIVEGEGPFMGQENPNSDSFIVITSKNIFEAGPQ